MSAFHYNNGDIIYEVHDSNLEKPKSTVVFIHGFGLDRREWTPQIDELTRNGNRVITYDMRGFGESSTPSTNYSHTDDLEALLKSLNVEGAILVGHSFGGEVAIDFAAKNPDKTEGLILMASSLGSFGVDKKFPIPRLVELAREGKMAEVTSELLEHESLTSLKQHPKGFELVQTMISGYSGWHFSHNDLGEPNLEVAEELTSIKCPVQIIIGGQDSESNRAISDEIRRRLPSADFQLIEGAGHFLNLEAEEVINQTIGHFINTCVEGHNQSTEGQTTIQHLNEQRDYSIPVK